MLTGDLVRCRVRKSALHPSFLDPDDVLVREDAAWLCELAKDATARSATRGEIESTVAAEAQVRPDHKVLRGLAKVLMDRSEFRTGLEDRSPSELRETVFRRAAERGPLSLEPGPFGHRTAAEVLSELAEELGMTTESIIDGLYADRKEEQRVVRCGLVEPDALISRYNTALVQSVLLKATKLTVVLEAPTAPRVRQLLQYAKFHQLIHRARRDGEALHLEVDGPVSVLKQSTRYGMKLATFFGAVLLQENWRIEADVKWHKRGLKTLALDQTCGLVPHIADRGGYVTREATWFRERFEAADTEWVLEEGSVPIDLGGRAVVMPDFTFRKGEAVGHLEIVGYWRKDYLARRVEWLKAYGPGNLILAVSKKLVADGSVLHDFDGVVIPFAQIVPAKSVCAALDGLQS